jgi:hypothetical protein
MWVIKPGMRRRVSVTCTRQTGANFGPHMRFTGNMPIGQQTNHRGIVLGYTFIDQLFNSVGPQRSPSPQLGEQIGVERKVLGELCFRAGAASLLGGFASRNKTCLIQLKTVVVGDITGQVNGKAIGLPQVKRLFAGDDGLPLVGRAINSSSRARPLFNVRWNRSSSSVMVCKM